MYNYIKVELQQPSWNNGTSCSHLMKDCLSSSSQLFILESIIYLGLSFQKPLRSSYSTKRLGSNGHTTRPPGLHCVDVEGCLWLLWGPSLKLLRSLPSSATAPNPRPIRNCSLKDYHPAIYTSSTTTFPANFFQVPFGTSISQSTSSTLSQKVTTPLLVLPLSFIKCPFSAPLHPTTSGCSFCVSHQKLAPLLYPRYHPMSQVSFLNCLTFGHTPSFTEDFGIWLTASSPHWVSSSSQKISTPFGRAI